MLLTGFSGMCLEPHPVSLKEVPFPGDGRAGCGSQGTGRMLLGLKVLSRDAVDSGFLCLLRSGPDIPACMGNHRAELCRISDTCPADTSQAPSRAPPLLETSAPPAQLGLGLECDRDLERQAWGQGRVAPQGWG